MATLQEYKKKRSFSKTPEPAGGKASGKPSARSLQFVIQKHAASRLHYDFRLEMDGVLKSWAIPKGPSLNPADKRLAMQVEDHPFDYKDFEGNIPEGNYGAGTVIVWDRGTYEPLARTSDGKPGQEKELMKELKSGSLKFSLHGEKLKGEFALVRIKGKDDHSWLLIKHKDSYASEKPVTDKDKSVISKKRLEQIAADPTAKEWTSSPKKKPAKSSRASSKNSPMPGNLSPMLATLIDNPFDEEGWIYEIKWDGYRALSYLNGKKVEIRSRNNKDFEERFYPISAALQTWNVHALVDGEIVVIDEKGHSSFNALQNWRSEADGELFYYLFDLLWLDGKDLMGLPLSDRQEMLKSIAPAEGLLRLSQPFATSGTEFFEAAKKMGLEGIMAKKADSLYTPGIRTREWLKIKAANRQEVVIGGYTKNKGTSKQFSSLLVGVFENAHLRYTGKIGTGFSDRQQKEMMQMFRPLVQKKSPFIIAPDVNKPSRFRPNPPEASAVWLKPKLLCEVSFLEMTDEGVMRHPSFEGMREDKDARDVGPEKPLPTRNAASKPKNKKGMAKQVIKESMAPGKKERRTLLNPGDESQVRTINGHDISFTHLSKIFWPKEKITKRDLLNYYYQVAAYILPYLKNRPQSLNRHPNGIGGKSFYQKNVSGKVPDWIRTFPYHSAEDPEEKEFLVITDEASLLYEISLGCIEVNPWSSTVDDPDNPDWCIIDLDPDKKTPFDRVIEAAQVTRQVLESAGVKTYCKTSGSTGLHVYFPLGARYSYEQSKEFARVIVKIVQAEIPSFTSIERIVSARKGKMYLDFLQNRPQATLAAPYSVRPKPGATVSTPLEWEEVKKGMRPTDFTIHNVPSRLAERGDLFKPVIGKGIEMEKALQKLEKMMPAAKTT